MPLIKTKTFIEAPVNICFDFARSITIQKKVSLETFDRIIGGKDDGFLELGDKVVWKTFYFGKEKEMELKVTSYMLNIKFCEEMIKGPFKEYSHLHQFKEYKNGTIMYDEVEYQTPFSIIGKFLDKHHIEQYIETNLKRKIELIKKSSEKTL